MPQGLSTSSLYSFFFVTADLAFCAQVLLVPPGRVLCSQAISILATRRSLLMILFTCPGVLGTFALLSSQDNHIFSWFPQCLDPWSQLTLMLQSSFGSKPKFWKGVLLNLCQGLLLLAFPPDEVISSPFHLDPGFPSHGLLSLLGFYLNHQWNNRFTWQICMHIYVYMHICACVSMYLFMCVCICCCSCIFMPMCIYVHLYVCACSCLHAYEYSYSCLDLIPLASYGLSSPPSLEWIFEVIQNVLCIWDHLIFSWTISLSGLFYPGTPPLFTPSVLNLGILKNLEPTLVASIYWVFHKSQVPC